jgi:hypothetical protein
MLRLVTDKLSKISLEPPPESLTLANGSDEFVISFKRGREGEKGSIVYTWDQIISVLGPKMLDELPEGLMVLILRDKIALDEDNDPFYYVIYDEDFQTIKIQLVALGIIQKGSRQKDSGQTLWSLTPFGQHYTTALKAIKKPV